MSTASMIVVSRTGPWRRVVVPSPTCPTSLRPQHDTLPRRCSTQAASSPTETFTASLMFGYLGHLRDGVPEVVPAEHPAVGGGYAGLDPAHRHRRHVAGDGHRGRPGAVYPAPARQRATPTYGAAVVLAGRDRHRVAQAADALRPVAARPGGAVAQLPQVVGAPAGEIAVVVHGTRMLRVRRVVAGADRGHVDESRSAQVLPVAVVAPQQVTVSPARIAQLRPRTAAIWVSPLRSPTPCGPGLRSRRGRTGPGRSCIRP